MSSFPSSEDGAVIAELNESTALLLDCEATVAVDGAASAGAVVEAAWLVFALRRKFFNMTPYGSGLEGRARAGQLLYALYVLYAHVSENQRCKA